MIVSSRPCNAVVEGAVDVKETEELCGNAILYLLMGMEKLLNVVLQLGPKVR